MVKSVASGVLALGIGVSLLPGCSDGPEGSDEISNGVVVEETDPRFEIGQTGDGKPRLEGVEMSGEQIEAVKTTLRQIDSAVNSEKRARARFRFTLTTDEEIRIHEVEFSEEQFSAAATTVAKFEPKTAIHPRIGRDVPAPFIKRVIAICAGAGMNDVIF